ncbi:MAG: class B sortase [Defluviitaleaceae bacterium]|nr:class B sortase [Defluviitaleaceae bacterium]
MKLSSKTKIRILYAVLGVIIVIMAFFGISLAVEMHTDRQGRAFNAALPVDFIPRETVQLPNPDSEVRLFAEIISVEEEEEIAFVPLVDFDEMRNQFPSIVAWIQSEGTVINYPIVQGEDNDFYLDRLPNRQRHPWGSIFLDYRNAIDFSDSSILIYGHNMRSGDMFGSLKYYANQAHFEEHSTMLIFTPTNNFVLELFAGYLLDSAFEVPPMYFTDEEHFYSFVNNIRRRSIFQSEVEVNYGDRLVFLCTCTTGGNINERLIIVGRLVEF